MISWTGNFLLVLAIFSSILSALSGIILLIKSRLNYLQPRDLKTLANNILPKISYGRSNIYLKSVFQLSCASIILAFGCLVYGFIISDFSLQNIFLNSSTVKPLIFKIAGAWASHEGSMLLWLNLLTIVALFYVLFNRCTDGTLLAQQIIIISLIQLLFICFIYYVSNPFLALSFRPTQGLGLNPMLQDIALAIHPPILYLGYTSYLGVFVSGCLILINKERISYVTYMSVLENMKIFSGIGISLITVGIGLGSWWAYRELGWGGFWFFDPVENVSLMPWLTAIALHHSLIITLKNQQSPAPTLTLSIMTFLLVIFGTFLVRSGMLVSIHSFALSPERATYLLIIFAIIALPSIGLLVTNSKSSLPVREIASLQKLGIQAGNIFWILSLLILISGTVGPLVYFILRGEIVSLDNDYFIYSFIPLIIPNIILPIIFSVPTKRNIHIWIFSLATIITIIAGRQVKASIFAYIVILFSSYLLIHTTHIFLSKSDYFRHKIKLSTMSMIIGHFGFGLLALSITLNSTLQNETEFIGRVGDSVSFNNYNVILKTIRFSDGANYYRQIAEFWIEDSKADNITILKPENRFYKIERSLSQESDIYSYLTYDIYAVLSRVDEDIIYAKIYYRPMISFIWLAVFIMSIGLLLSIISKKQNL